MGKTYTPLTLGPFILLKEFHYTETLRLDPKSGLDGD